VQLSLHTSIRHFFHLTRPASPPLMLHATKMSPSHRGDSDGMQRRGLGPVRCGPSRRREHREPTALKNHGKRQIFDPKKLHRERPVQMVPPPCTPTVGVQGGGTIWTGLSRCSFWDPLFGPPDSETFARAVDPSPVIGGPCRPSRPAQLGRF